MFSPFRDLAGNAVWKNILVDICAAVVEISLSVVLGCCLKRVKISVAIEKFCGFVSSFFMPLLLEVERFL